MHLLILALAIAIAFGIARRIFWLAKVTAVVAFILFALAFMGVIQI